MELFKFLRIFLYVIKSYIGFFFSSKMLEVKNLTNKNALFITPFRREEKLDLILNDLDIGIVNLNNDFQKKIHGIFFLKYGLRYYEHIDKINSQKFRIFFYKIYLSNLLKHIKKKYKIKIIINFAIHYKSEFLFDFLTTSNKMKFLTFHRECLYANENTKEFIKSKLIKSPKFKGTKLIVHNEVVKKVFYETNFCEKNKIEVIGPLKTDDNLKLKNQINLNKKNKTILFYIFGTGSMIMDDINYGSDWIENGWTNLLDNTYNSLTFLAEKFNDCEFIFKAKYDSSSYLDYHKRKLKNFRGNNIKYQTKDTNYSYLLKSDLVISYNSTTIVEAILFNKELLIPMFDEALSENFKKFIGFKELSNTNLVCRSKEEFIKKISLCIEEKSSFKLNEKNRLELLKNYIGEIDGKNYERVKKLIKNELN